MRKIANINIIRPRDGWALQRIAESWKIPGSQLGTFPDSNADVNLWVNYALFKSVGNFHKTNCDVGYFTHREEGTLGELFDSVAESMDWCIAMCEKTARLLPNDKTTVVHSSPHSQFRKENVILGVCGRDYPRKNNRLIPELQEIPGVEVRYTGGELRFDQLPGWYRSIDYLLVLSEIEGGPLPVLEALAMGKPVIAPDAGWCWDYPVIRYAGFENLVSIVRRLIVPDVQSESEKIVRAIERACR